MDGRNQRCIKVCSTGGTYANQPLICKVGTTPKREDKVIWKVNVKQVQEYTREELLQFIPRDITQDCSTQTQQEQCTEAINDDGSDLSQGSTANISENNILRSMLKELIKVGKKDIWACISPRMLYKYHLCDADAIQSSFVVAELNALNEVYKRFTKQSLFNKSDKKEFKVNKICKKFGDETTWKSNTAICKSPKSLRDHAFKIVSSGMVPKAVVAVSMARIKHTLTVDTWMKDAPIDLKLFIEHRNEFFDLYAFSEYSQERKVIEPRTLDPTHILTNLRAHASKAGFDFFDKDAFIRVSEKDKILLPRPLITEVIDQQNAEIAQRFFSQEVEDIMESNGDLKEAGFLQLIRQWYEACDARGITANERVNRLISVHNYFCQFVNFHSYPPPSTHVLGIPIITFEGLLQGISIRLMLYGYSNMAFSMRSISTLKATSPV